MQGKEQNVTIPAGVKIKQAVLQGKAFWQGGNLVKVGSSNTDITAIIRSSVKPSETIIEDSKHLWSISDSEYPVYFWIEGSILKYWTEANKILLSSDSSQMFMSWSVLSDISGIRDFETNNVTNMDLMFVSCTAITDLSAIENWDTSKVTSMYAMFNNDKFTEANLSKWNTSNVNNMNGMFSNCQNLKSINLSNWDTSNVTGMNAMFGDCSMLKNIYVSNTFVTTAVTDSTRMFNNCTSLVGGDGTTFDSTKIDKTYAHIDGGTSNPGYFTAK